MKKTRSQIDIYVGWACKNHDSGIETGLVQLKVISQDVQPTIIVEELWSVLLKAPARGSEDPKVAVGLGFDTDQVGVSLMIGGALLLPYQIAIFPKLADALGELAIMKWFSLALMFMYAGFPMLAWLQEPGWIWLGIVVMQSLKVGCYASVFTCVLMLYSHVCLGPHLGYANGVSQSASSAIRMAAPLVGGWVWSGSLLVDTPGHQWSAYLMCAGFNAIGMVVIWRLPPGVEPRASGSTSGLTSDPGDS